MRRFHLLLFLFASLPLLSSCQNQAPQTDVDLAKLRQEVQKKTEKLYAIHLRLDTAANEILKAESLAESGDCSSAQYVAADAYRSLEKGDQALLELGAELQALFNLDVEKANR